MLKEVLRKVQVCIRKISVVEKYGLSMHEVRESKLLERHFIKVKYFVK